MKNFQIKDRTFSAQAQRRTFATIGIILGTLLVVAMFLGGGNPIHGVQTAAVSATTGGNIDQSRKIANLERQLKSRDNQVTHWQERYNNERADRIAAQSDLRLLNKDHTIFVDSVAFLNENQELLTDSIAFLLERIAIYEEGSVNVKMGGTEVTAPLAAGIRVVELPRRGSVQKELYVGGIQLISTNGKDSISVRKIRN